jgi:hypothetical protein
MWIWKELLDPAEDHTDNETGDPYPNAYATLKRYLFLQAAQPRVLVEYLVCSIPQRLGVNGFSVPWHTVSDRES